MGLGRESSNVHDSASESWEFVRSSGVWSQLAFRTELNSIPVQRCSPSLPTGSTSLKSAGPPRSLLSEFTSAWERGLAPLVDTYLARLDPTDVRGGVELVYREFCLLEAAGKKPDIAQYLRRFPGYAEPLARLLGLHDACSPSLLQHWVKSAPVTENLPIAGNEVGPYFLRREVGRGSFARVFLAEQVNLENRLVVVKVATRLTREPWLLARVRHPHIVDVVSHAIVEDCGFHLICMPFLGGATLSTVLAQPRRRWPGAPAGELLADLDSVAAPEFPVSQAAHPAREILAALSYDQAIAWIGARLADALNHAFSKEVAHGDVKPSNILLAADGSPMLLDFNLARDGSPLGSNDVVGEPGGTLAYMAPERLWALATSAPDRAGARASRDITSGSAGAFDSPSESSPGETPSDYCASSSRHLLTRGGLARSVGPPHFRGVRPRSSDALECAIEQHRINRRGLRESADLKCMCARRRGRSYQWTDDSSRSSRGSRTRAGSRTVTPLSARARVRRRSRSLALRPPFRVRGRAPLAIHDP